MKSILIVAYVLENNLIWIISRTFRGTFSIFTVFHNNHNVLNTASETPWLSLTTVMMERVLITASDIIENHFATLHTSNKRVQNYTLILNLIVSDKMPCVPFLYVDQTTISGGCDVFHLWNFCWNVCHMWKFYALASISSHKIWKRWTFMVLLTAKHELPNQ